MEVAEEFKVTKGKYLEQNPEWHVEDSEWKARQILKMLGRNNVAPATIGEIGCGAGEILNQLQQKMTDKSIDFTGYEIAPDAFNLCQPRQKEKLSFYNDDLLALDKRFDLLLIIDVFEHVQDYMSFIKGTAQKGQYKMYHIPLDISIFAILINNFKYVRGPGGHIHYFNKFTALETLKDCGLEVIDYFYTPGAVEQNQKNLTLFSRVLNFLRRVFYKISPDATANWLGGYSLMVLTK